MRTGVDSPLRCRNNHEWDPARDFAVGQVTGAACPTCGEPPLLEGTEFWERGSARGWLIIILTACLLCATVSFFGWQWRDAITIVFASLGALFFLLFRRILPARKLKVVARALDLTYSPAVPPELRKTMAKLTLVDSYSADCLAGSYRGSPILLMNVTHQVLRRKGRLEETVVVFPDPVSNLPDFTLEPIRTSLRFGNPGHFWNKDLLQLVGLRRPEPLQDEPFGLRYCLQDGRMEALGGWLTKDFRDLLAQHPGWCIQARQGVLLFYRQRQVYPPEGLPTLLALAWQLREMLRKAGAALVPGEET